MAMHAGEWVGYAAEMHRFPEQETTIICLASRTDISPTCLCVKVTRVLLGGQLGTNPRLETRRQHPAAMEPPATVEDTGFPGARLHWLTARSLIVAPSWTRI